jgi:hypothetical protein
MSKMDASEISQWFQNWTIWTDGISLQIELGGPYTIYRRELRQVFCRVERN